MRQGRRHLPDGAFKDPKIVNPRGRIHDVVIVFKTGANASRERVKARLMSELIDRLCLMGDVLGERLPPLRSMVSTT